MGQYETLNVIHSDGLAWISFNRPNVLNAFNLLQWRELKTALRDAEGDSEARVVILGGEGGNFSAGYDLTAALGGDLAEPMPNAFREYVEVGNAACWAVWELKKPVISAIRGHCLGGAFELAMACDFAYADTSAQLGEPEVLLSDAPPFLISPWVLGMRQAKHILLSGELISAETAMQYGILNRVCAPEELEPTVTRMAKRLMGFAPETWHQNKSAVNRSYEIMGFRSCVAMGTEAFVITNVTPNALKSEFLERFDREGFSAAIKWVQSRYAT
ncbi:MAG: enoyl-CoA hydratase/isomerase family protein [Alphaproteobacteria bacterium]|nr:enoyl-CoA hydratase/isomerase family protein [Alphaproteobacteria bacterium]